MFHASSRGLRSRDASNYSFVSLRHIEGTDFGKRRALMCDLSFGPRNQWMPYTLWLGSLGFQTSWERFPIKDSLPTPFSRRHLDAFERFRTGRNPPQEAGCFRRVFNYQEILEPTWLYHDREKLAIHYLRA